MSSNSDGPYKIEEDAAGYWYLMFLGEHTGISGDKLCDGVIELCKLLNLKERQHRTGDYI
jgi:hypothetical protein